MNDDTHYPTELLIRLQCTEDFAQELKMQVQQELNLSAKEVSIGPLPSRETEWLDPDKLILGLYIIVTCAPLVEAVIQLIWRRIAEARKRKVPPLGRPVVEVSAWPYGIHYRIEADTTEEILEVIDKIHQHLGYQEDPYSEDK